MPERSVTVKTKTKINESIATGICLHLIRFYITFLSPLKPRICRFYPSCSQYTCDALEKYGLFKGLMMGARRLLSCHPFNPGGYHPVD